MKRLLLTATLCMCFGMSMLAQFSGSGSGTENDPYLIFNETQLSQMANFLGKDGVVFKLMNDLDLTDWIAENSPSQGWLPIGVESSPFKGKLYGNNHKISGLMISRSSSSFVGFFGKMEGATVTNLTLSGTTVEGTSVTGFFAGNTINCTFTNIKVSGTHVKGGGFFIGNDTGSRISSVSVSGQIDGNGGLVGYGNSTTVENINASVSVSGNIAVGGVVGEGHGLTIKNAKAVGNLSGTADVGGIVGNLEGACNLSNCSYKGDIKSGRNSGGIAGYLYIKQGGNSTSVSFTSCSSKSMINVTGDCAGGILGMSNGGCIAGMESCSHFGEIHGDNYVGGLIGCMSNSTSEPVRHTWTVKIQDYKHYSEPYYSYSETIREGQELLVPINNCSSIGNIEGNNNVGGLIGFDQPAYSYIPITSEKTVPSESNYYYFYLYKDGSYANRSRDSRFDFTFTVTDYQRSKTSLSLTNNYYSSKIKGAENVGGLVGYKTGGTIQNNYSYATINGTSYVGGIIGKSTGDVNEGSSNTITIKSNVANDATISATKGNVGRIYGSVESQYATIGAVGSNESNRALATSKVVLSGVVQEVKDDLPNGTSVGTSALKLKANYVAWGWDFDNNWNILETECFPYKKYQAAPPVIESDLVSQATTISGKSVNGGTVYLYYKDRDAVSTKTNNNKWSFTTEALQSGATVQTYADVDGMTPSYFTQAIVGYLGSGTEADPYRIYTAADLQGVYKKGYYKLMNDVDLTSWINENSAQYGWPAIGKNGVEGIVFDGGNHKITGLWCNYDNDFNGLFSNFPEGTFRNLTVETASGKTVNGNDYSGILVGRLEKGVIDNVSIKGSVSGTHRVGAIAGALYGSASVKNVHINAEVTNKRVSAYSFVGGIAGYAENGTFTDNNIEVKIKSASDSCMVGGLIGSGTGNTIERCAVNVNSNSTGKMVYAGGLIGEAKTNGAKISTSYTKGDIIVSGADGYAGGLVGILKAGSVSDSYSKANVTASEYSAGLVAYNLGTVTNSYAAGDVKSTLHGAGAVGYNDGANAKVSNLVAANAHIDVTDQSGWSIRVLGGFKNGAAQPGENNYALSTMILSVNGVAKKVTDNILDGYAKTENELKTGATYKSFSWNFTDTWGIDEGKGYPYLKWEREGKAVTSIAFDKKALTLQIGKSDSIAVTILPVDATTTALAWTSSDEKVATVANGKVTAVAEGAAYIVATTTDGSNLTDTCKVTVTVSKEAAIDALQALVDKAQSLYDNSTEGTEIGQYASGSRAELLAVINEVKATISDTMSDEAISSGTTKINDAVTVFESKKVTAGEDTDLSTLENAIYINKVESRPGAKATLSIRLKNKIKVQGYQFDLILPDGVTVAKDADGIEEVAVSSERTTARKFDLLVYNTKKSGAFAVSCASTRQYLLDGNDGEVLTINVNIDSSMVAGDYPIIIKNQVFSDETSTAFYCDYVKSTLTLSSYLLGDVNGDGKINIADVTATSGYVVDNPPANFIKAAADMNGDGLINIADVTAIATYIVENESTSAKGSSDFVSVEDELSIETSGVSKGNATWVDVNVYNPMDRFSGLQFDLTLPDGLTLEDVKIGDRSSDVSSNLIMYKRLNDNTYRVLAASTPNKDFIGTSGNVVKLLVRASKNVKVGQQEVMLRNIVLGNNEKAIYLEDALAAMAVSQPTGIEGLGIEPDALVDVCSVSGMLLRHNVEAKDCLRGLPQGVYIVNGKKVTIK